MDPSPLKIIPILDNIVVLPNLADKVNLWRDKYTTEVEKKGYFSKMGKDSKSIELRKNYRGRTEILFSEDQNNILANFSYKAPFYCKFILIALFISFFAFLMISVVCSALDEFYLFNLSLAASLTSLCTLAIFGLAFLFLIAKYDSSRHILLPDQRIELISTAQTVQIAQDSSVISESSYSNKHDPLPDMYNNIKIFYNVPNIDVWKERFLDLVKENSYLSKDQSYFNYLQLIKANRTFEIGFKWNHNILLTDIEFRPHNYFIVTSLGLLLGMPVTFGLMYSFRSLFLLFLIIVVILLISFIVFLLWYMISVAKVPLKGKIAAPEYIDELMALASKAAEFSSTQNQ